MATQTWTAVNVAGATLSLSYDTVTLAVTRAVVDTTGATQPVNYTIVNNGVTLDSGTLQPGNVHTFNVPAGVLTLVQITGHGGLTGIGFPPGLTVSAGL